MRTDGTLFKDYHEGDPRVNTKFGVDRNYDNLICKYRLFFAFGYICWVNKESQWYCKLLWSVNFLHDD